MLVDQSCPGFYTLRTYVTSYLLMSFTISRLPKVILRTLLAVSITLTLVACGGGGGGGGGGTSYTTLFEDNFDAGVSRFKWTESGLGTVAYDAAIGYPAAGSMKLGGDSKMTALISSFLVGNGIEVHVRVRIPANTVAASNTLSGAMINIDSQELGTGRAHVSIWRSSCTSPAGPTRFEYFIQTPGGGGNTIFYESFNCNSAPAETFVDFAFIVYSDGSTEWQRDGITMLRYIAAPFGSGAVNLNLHGGGPFLGVIPNFYLWYDDILVVN